jgi:hypothetical protein
MKGKKMRIFNASVNLNVLLRYHDLFPSRRLNILKSFGNIDHEMSSFAITHRDKFGGFILDSGVWTLNNARSVDTANINVITYRDYLLSHGHHFEFYFNFDEIFFENGFGVNWSNQVQLQNAGLKPVPVVHDIYNNEISTYIDAGYKRIALGSAQIKSVNQMAHAMRQFDGKGIKVHLFGNTTFDYLAYFPITTADSTTSIKTAAFGNILYWNPQKDGDNKTDLIYLDERLRAGKKKRVHFDDYKFLADLEAYLDENFGLTYDDLIGPESNDFKTLVNAHYFVLLEEVINQLHKQQGFDTME